MRKKYNTSSILDNIENNINKLSLLDIIMLHLLIERGMSRTEISKKTGIPYNATRQAILQAIKKVKDEIVYK